MTSALMRAFSLPSRCCLLQKSCLGPRIAEAAEHFVTSGVVGESDYQKFDSYMDAALRSRDSVLAEIVIAVIAYLGTIYCFRRNGSSRFNMADKQRRLEHFSHVGGLVVVLVCVPLLQFLVLRWLWRLFLWFQFLNRVSKLDMQLFPTHPDESGGTGIRGRGTEVLRHPVVRLFCWSCRRPCEHDRL